MICGIAELCGVEFDGGMLGVTTVVLICDGPGLGGLERVKELDSASKGFLMPRLGSGWESNEDEVSAARGSELEGRPSGLAV